MGTLDRAPADGAPADGAPADGAPADGAPADGATTRGRVRIGKADHPRILRMLDVERLRVADIAAAYGCTPANIYTLASKLRRAGAASSEIAPPAPPPSEPATDAAISPPAIDLFQAAVPMPTRPTRAPIQAAPPPPPLAPLPPAPLPLAPARKPAPAARAVGASLAKPGFGLAMRSAEGEESLAPFRSLEDLLSGIKPILRDAARSSDPVWFSIRQIDLATVDSDAA